LGRYPLDLAAPGSFCLKAEVPVGDESLGAAGVAKRLLASWNR
jgi:hypothetical protein